MVQTAFGVPVNEGPGLFVRIFNTGNPCWLDGRPAVSLRDDHGDWHAFTFTAGGGPTTNGPKWTGVFDPRLVGVVVFGQPRGSNDTGTPERYTALRLTLPNKGGTLDFDGIDMTLTSTRLTVSSIEADSQDS